MCIYSPIRSEFYDFFRKTLPSCISISPLATILFFQLLYQLVEQMEGLDRRVSDAERVRSQWLPASEMVVDNINEHIDSVKVGGDDDIFS